MDGEVAGPDGPRRRPSDRQPPLRACRVDDRGVFACRRAGRRYHRPRPAGADQVVPASSRAVGRPDRRARRRARRVGGGGVAGAEGLHEVLQRSDGLVCGDGACPPREGRGSLHGQTVPPAEQQGIPCRSGSLPPGPRNVSRLLPARQLYEHDGGLDDIDADHLDLDDDAADRHSAILLRVRVWPHARDRCAFPTVRSHRRRCSRRSRRRHSS